MQGGGRPSVSRKPAGEQIGTTLVHTAGVFASNLYYICPESVVSGGSGSNRALLFHSEFHSEVGDWSAGPLMFFVR